MIDDDRRPLGPIGTERASRRPPAAAVHLADMNVMPPPPPPTAGDDIRDSWNMYTDGQFSLSVSDAAAVVTTS